MIFLSAIFALSFLSPCYATVEEQSEKIVSILTPSADESADTWPEILQDSLDLTCHIQSSVERNRLRQLLKALLVSNQTSDTSTLKRGTWVQDCVDIVWQWRAKKIEQRLTCARHNLPKGADKELIISILERLNQETANKAPKDSQKKQAALPLKEPFPEELNRLLLSELPNVKKHLKDFSPTVFISYASGDSEKAFAEQMAKYLTQAGIKARLDLWHSGLSNALITQFVNEIDLVDYVLVIGSPLYLEKHHQKKNNVVFIEVRIIAERYKSQPSRILSIIHSGSAKEALPSFLRDDVYADFTNPQYTIRELNKVILALSKYADDIEGLKKILKDMEAHSENTAHLP